jgi:hypothetical protein
MRLNLFSAVVATVLVVNALAQADYDYADYQDYAGDYGQQDNLYYDYAQRQDSKGYACAIVCVYVCSCLMLSVSRCYGYRNISSHFTSIIIVPTK